MIVLFTDFGICSPYVAQLHAVLAQQAPGAAVIDLHADLAPWNIQAAAYLLPAYAPQFPAGSVFLCVVDPGVGGSRRAVAVRCAGHWWVGPDNGLLRVLTLHYPDAELWEIVWRPQRLSNSFHGRDLFAPVAARLHQHDLGDLRPLEALSGGADWPADLAAIIYADHYGNLFTGLRAADVSPQRTVRYKQQRLAYAETFCAVPRGQGFWYENAIGLVELALNQGSAQQIWQARIGDPVDIY